MAIDAIRFRLLVFLIYHTRVYGGWSGNEEWKSEGDVDSKCRRFAVVSQPHILHRVHVVLYCKISQWRAKDLPAYNDGGRDLR